MNADHGGANVGVPGGQRQHWPAAGPAGMLPSPPAPGAAQAGRHREHLFPGRPHRVSPSFSAQEYAAVVAAAARVGLTPTGYCAHATLALAAGPEALPHSTATASGDTGRDAATVEALAALQAELADTRTAVVRVGTNLNQAVRVLNTTGEVPMWLQHVAELCARAVAAVDAAATQIHRRL